MKEFVISKNEAGQRFDKYLAKLLPNAANSFFYKMLRKKNITLNGKKAEGNEKLAEGDLVKLFLSDETFDNFSSNMRDKISLSLKTNQFFKYKERIEVIYEDEDVLILNKPDNMLSQKAKEEDYSINEWIIDYLFEEKYLSDEMLKTFKPSVCNRLDRNTTGLILAGKSLKGLQVLSEMLKERTVSKFYTCIVKGCCQRDSKLSGHLYKDEKTNKVFVSSFGSKEFEGKSGITDIGEIRTNFKTIYSNDELSYLEVELITGKTHQIRAHLASAGYPIIGDMKYGDSKTNNYFYEKYKVKSQMLHSKRIEFPKNCEIETLSGFVAQADEPYEFKKLLSCFRGE